MLKKHLFTTDLKKINGEDIYGDGNIVIEQNMTGDTLTPEQMDYLRDKQIKFGSWRCESIPSTSYTAPSIKLPFFRTKKNGQLTSQNETDFLFKKGVHYSIDMSYSVLTTNGAILAIALVNTVNNAVIGDCYKTSRINVSGANNDISGARIFTVNEDTVGTFKITYLSSSPLTITLSEIKVNITEISSFDVSLKNFKINGKTFDENNNIDLVGLSNLSSPKLNVETLTEYRHPISGKPIYEKAFDFGALPNNTAKNVAHKIDCEWILVDYKSSYAYSTVTGTTASVMNGSYSRMYVNGRTSIECTTTSDLSSYRAIVVLRYTKTTDTAESPVRLVGGGFKYIESGTEPNNPSLGDEWHNTTNDILYKRRKKNGILGWYEI